MVPGAATDCGQKNIGNVGNPTQGCTLVIGAEREGMEIWLALAAITVAAATGFNFLALAIHYES